MAQWLEFFGESASLLIMIVSLFGLIIPIFPGLVIIWVVTLLYGIVSGFGTAGGIIFLIITVLTIAGLLVDNVLMGAKVRERGASWRSIALAFGAGILGTLIFPPIGGVIAAPLTLFIAEQNRLKDREKALEVVKALAVGWGWAFVARFGIGVVMVILWGIWAFTN